MIWYKKNKNTIKIKKIIKFSTLIIFVNIYALLSNGVWSGNDNKKMQCTTNEKKETCVGHVFAT